MVLSRILFPVLMACAVATPAPASESTAPAKEYTAVYKVLRNGKELAAVTIELSQEQDVWKLHGFTHDTRGLARFLNIRGTQTAVGKWLDGQFRPENYSFSFSLAGFRKSWQALFDWQSNLVTTKGSRGALPLQMSEDTNDPLSLSLNLRSELVKKQAQMSAYVVEEDKIKDHVYKVIGEEPTDTALGCINTTRLERLRDNPDRVSQGWYASNYNFIPVRMQHKSTKGNNFELQITALEIEGQAIAAVAPC
jgi:hypothetical protein